MSERKSNLKEAWSPAEYAEKYGVCRATVYNWLKAGLLDSKKIVGARRILKEHDEEFRARFVA